tara:strand:- start:645 stop:938 length:294 start_codon:yes stop_codon:yes gene_type:complete
MNPSEELQNIKAQYYDEIKPLIERESPLAQVEFGNIAILLDTQMYRRMYGSFPHGQSFIASSQMLWEDLQKGEEDPAYEFFETHMGQLEMAISSGNT